ncbi:hypothetical protein GOP47_0014626 [Adiantum capillus-veneris]|uniref:protein-serine/threonine phosphatase n=1 Tax=Adiantum capillus-veneris TaxID=13818 RepID=A0A9D4ZCC3_ADICA|nr:hypothetical protein GOP47_0014626 [Adiantum capillus-veneris]
MLQRIKNVVRLGRRKKSGHDFRHGLFVSKGKCNHPMEDFAVSETRRIDGNRVGLFAIYDGHVGHEVAEYLQANLLNNILNQPSFWTDPTTAITEAYLKTDKCILEKEAELGMGGSTAVTAIVINGASVYIANVGDSRAVLCRAGVATQVTVDHDPVSEKASIERKGGLVTTLPGLLPL